MRDYSRREFLAACSLGGAAAAAGHGSALPVDGSRDARPAPETRWNETYSTGSDDEAVAITSAPDGSGFALVGTTDPGPDSNRRMWLFKLDGSGQKQWGRTYEVEPETVGQDITATDDGYLVVGTASSPDREGQRGVAIKVDTDGAKQWRQKYELRDGSRDELRAVTTTPDAGFVLGGWTKPLDDAWAVKIDRTGGEIWNKTYDNGGDDRFYAATLGDDGGYFFAGDSTGGSTADRRGWAVEIATDGDRKFSESFRVKTDDLTNEENNRNAFRDAVRGRNGYLLVGDTSKRKNTDDRSAWAVKINGFGKKDWQREISVDTYNRFYGVVRDELQFYLAGETAADAARTDRRGLLTKVDFTGSQQWISTYSARGSAAFSDMVLADDGGLVPAGGAEPSYQSSDEAAWAVKVGGEEVSTPTPTPTDTPTDTPTATPTPTPTPSDGSTPTPTDTPTPETTPAPTDSGSGLTTTQPPSGAGTSTTAAEQSGGGMLLPIVGGGFVAALLGAGAYLYYRSEGEAGGAQPADDAGPDSGPGPAPGTAPGGPGQGGTAEPGVNQPQGGQPHGGQGGQPQGGQGGQPQGGQGGQPQGGQGGQPRGGRGGQPQGGQGGQPQGGRPQGGQPQGGQGGQPQGGRGGQPQGGQGGQPQGGQPQGGQGGQPQGGQGGQPQGGQGGQPQGGQPQGGQGGQPQGGQGGQPPQGPPADQPPADEQAGESGDQGQQDSSDEEVSESDAPAEDDTAAGDAAPSEDADATEDQSGGDESNEEQS